MLRTSEGFFFVKKPSKPADIQNPGKPKPYQKQNTPMVTVFNSTITSPFCGFADFLQFFSSPCFPKACP